jgi:16S rRNA (cytidine1402-2'-O)-methyltransferase
VTSDTPSDDRATQRSGASGASKSPAGRSSRTRPRAATSAAPDDPASARPTSENAAPAQALPAGLHIVATPIGNAADISLRALDVLRRADLIACEDTRVTGNLLIRYGIGTRRLAYNDHNAERMRPLLLDRMRRNERVALVSDAGMPLVSDPGYKLVRDVIAEGLPVTTVPGASAPLAALALSGLPSDRFLFAGFLPSRAAARRHELVALAGVPATLIFFESARRLGAALGDMAATLGDRPAAVAREMTKRFEEVRRDKLTTLAAHYAAAGPPKGEIVVVVGPPATAPPKDDTEAAATLDDMLHEALAGASLRDAAAAVAIASGLPRRLVYARALTLVGPQDKAPSNKPLPDKPGSDDR